MFFSHEFIKKSRGKPGCKTRVFVWKGMEGDIVFLVTAKFDLLLFEFISFLLFYFLSLTPKNCVL